MDLEIELCTYYLLLTPSLHLDTCLSCSIDAERERLQVPVCSDQRIPHSLPYVQSDDNIVSLYSSLPTTYMYLRTTRYHYWA